MALRFRVASVKNARHTDHNIIDLVTQNLLVTTRYAQNAEFVTAKLNAQVEPEPEWRGLVASVLCSFRQKLEQDNSGPLTDEPTIALLFSDFCDHLKFNTGERALALGPEMLVYLDKLDRGYTSIQVINSDSSIPVRDLVVGEELRVA